MNKEFVVAFHVNAETLEDAKKWAKNAVEILDNNFFALSGHLVGDDDTGAFCSGHIF